MMNTNKFDNNKKTYTQVKGSMALLFVVQLLFMMLAFFATYTPVHAEESAVKETNPVVKDEEMVDDPVDGSVVNTVGIFKNLKQAEKNEATGSANSSYLLQLVSGLLIVLLSIVVLAWIAKRFNRMQSPGGGNLRIVEGISMGARERVVVVEVDGERLLLGVSPGRINMLHSLAGGGQTDDALSEKRPQKNDEATFSQKIAAAMMKERS